MALFTLLTTKGAVHSVGGLNWGSNSTNHTRILDAYIPIHLETTSRYAGFVTLKSTNQNQNLINVTGDDGIVMQCRFEGNITDKINGNKYPKQISSYPHKDTLGIYFRRRLNVLGTRPVVMRDLITYGRTDVEITHLGANNYNFNFL